jgi:molecular chaperone HscA
MIFGIDFGTTFTLVSYFEEDLKFIKFNHPGMGEDFLPTNVSGIENLKREVGTHKNVDTAKVVEFFNQIKRRIEEQLGFEEEYYNVVLSVPVRFDDVARAFIKSCALAAKFNIIKLISEPISAAIAEIDIKKDGYYLIYDLGGGTFDLSLLKFQGDIFQVVEIDGLGEFGGIDIDAMIARELKCSNETAQSYKEKGEFSEEIKLKIQDMLEPTYKMVEKISNNVELTQLILVGGSSQLRMIFEKLSMNFNVILAKDCQKSVAKGAAMYGKFLQNNEFVLIDATPFNLGIETLGDEFEILIPKNSPIPIVKARKFMPVNEKVLINVIQGVEQKASECISLKKFIIEAKEPFVMEFFLDCDGILSIKIEEVIHIVSQVFAKSTQDDDITQMRKKIDSLPELNFEQENFKKYIENYNSELSLEAKIWLKEKFEELFY